MRFINKKSVSVTMLVFIVFITLTGCGKVVELGQEYELYTLSATGNASSNAVAASTLTESGFMSEELCVATESDISVDEIDHVYVGAGGVFDLTNKEVLYGYQLFEQKFPASTTKILTAYVVLKHCSLDEKVTISENAMNLPEGAVSSGFNVGDVLSVQDLLYALMLLSGNDAAIALAEHVSGSIESFAQLMNEEAKLLGATNTHFVNPNGLHNDEHYTTAYDMYLIFNEAIKSETFLQIINATTYTAVYQSVRGSTVEKTYTSTNQFLTGEKDFPDNFTIIGGKTGTTYDAGKCLILLVKDEDGNPYILIGLGCDTRERLYNFLEAQMEYINQLREK